MRILVVGVGYVGLVSGACFAEMGNQVTCLDIDTDKIEKLTKGKCPIYEPLLEEMILRNQAQKRLSFTVSYKNALVPPPEVVFLCLPTPQSEEGCQLGYLMEAIKQLATHLKHPTLVVNKSTAPIGTTTQIETTVNQFLKQQGHPFSVKVLSNPEFLKEGNAVLDCLKPDRIIIGGSDKASIKILEKLYSPFVVNHNRLVIMDIPSAEMTKYAANAMLATRISFMNEIAALCEAVDADVRKVRIGIGLDPRIGLDFLYAGAGYGGSCFPKDLHALKAQFRKKNLPSALLDATVSINKAQKKRLFKKLQSYFRSLEKVKIAVWGLAFKPGTDDIRGAPAIDLITALLANNCYVTAYDPVAMENTQAHFKDAHGLAFAKTEYDAAFEADAIVLVTEWKQFRVVDLFKIKTLMQGNGFFDGRNQYNEKEMQELGFDYFGIGLKKINPLVPLLSKKAHAQTSS